jgi:hypothetical protein
MHENTASIKKAPEFISGATVKKFYAEAISALEKDGYKPVEDSMTVRIPIDKLPDDLEVPLHFIPSLKHEHFQSAPSIREIFLEWMQGKFKTFKTGEKNDRRDADKNSST